MERGTEKMVEKYLSSIQNSHSTFNRLKEIERDRSGKLLKELTNPQLVELHRKCHMLFEAWKKSGKVNQDAFSFIINVHTKIVKEMERRKLNHNSPLEIIV